MNIQYSRGALRVHWGSDSLLQLDTELMRAGVSRPIVICGHSIAGDPQILTAIDDAVQGKVVGVFDGVQPNSPLESVISAADHIRELKADSIVAVGGGSAMVTARAANIVLCEGEGVAQLSTRLADDGSFISPRLMEPKLPFFALPTTPTTAITKAGCALTSPKHQSRLSMFDPKTRARVVIVHPDFVLKTPLELVQPSALNSLVSSIEGMISSSSNHFSGAALSYAARMLLNLVPRLGADPGDAGRRVDLILASLLVAEGTDTAGGGLSVALAHTIGYKVKVHNGIIYAIVLPHVLDLVAATAPDSLISMAHTLGSTESDIRDSLATVFDSTGIPERLRDVGVAQSALEDFAHEAMNDFAMRTFPAPICERDVLAVVRAAW